MAYVRVAGTAIALGCGLYGYKYSKDFFDQKVYQIKSKLDISCICSVY